MGLFFPSLLPTLKTLRILHFTSPLTVPDTDFQAPIYTLSGIAESLIFSSQPSPWLFTSFLLMKQANLLSRCNVTLLIQNSEDKQRKRIKQLLTLSSSTDALIVWSGKLQHLMYKQPESMRDHWKTSFS